MQFRRAALGLATLFAVSIGASSPNAQQPGFPANLSTGEAMRGEQRIALVIGNSAYGSKIGRLANPVNDAADFAEALRAADFEVMLELDIERDEMLRAVVDFGRALRDGGVGLFYYAGHAIQVDGNNYLIPLGAKIETEDYIQVETVDVNQVLARMGGADNRLNIVILDSCRNNPFRSTFRSVTRGLAPTLAPSGTYIAYAAAPGDVALDGDSRNSPYTSALLDVLGEPGLRLEDVFKLVAGRVLSRTNGSQTPWTASSITGDFYFHLPEPEQMPPAAVQAPAAAPTYVNVWNAIANSQDPVDFQIFLETFPDSPLAPFAQRRMERLQSTQVATLMSEELAERSPRAAASGDDAGTKALSALQSEPTTGPGRAAVPLAEPEVPATPATRERPAPAEAHESRPLSEPAADPIMLFRVPGSEKPLTRQTPVEPDETNEAQIARLVEEERKEALPRGNVRQLDLAKVNHLGECEAFLDGVYEDGLQVNGSRFQTCSNLRRGGPPVRYQQPGCTDPIWSQMEGPERCRPFVSYACEIYSRKMNFLAKCKAELAKRQ
jgi:hypothetical protein